MKKITMVKVLLDIMMTIVFVLLYNKMVFGGITFHMAAGLTIGAVFIIHIALNWRWVKQVTLNLFSGKMSIKTKIGYLVDGLLLISIAYIILSGMIIAKMIFQNLSMSYQMFFKVTHMSIAYLTLVLVGIHLGLHWDWVINTFKRIFKITEAKKIGCYAAKIAMVAVLISGIYSMYSTNYLKKLPVVKSVISGGQVSTMNKGTGTAPSGEGGGQMQEKPASASGEANGSSEMQGSKSGMEGNHGAPPNGMSAPSVNPLSVIAKNAGIIGTFAIVTFYIEKLLGTISARKKGIQLKQV